MKKPCLVFVSETNPDTGHVGAGASSEADLGHRTVDSTFLFLLAMDKAGRPPAGGCRR